MVDTEWAMAWDTEWDMVGIVDGEDMVADHVGTCGTANSILCNKL